MGVPSGWCSLRPIEADVRKAHFSFSKPLLRMGWTHPTVSLFSGCGALDLGLLPWCTPVAYCEICPFAADILNARMRDGSLPPGPVFPDARRLTKESFMTLQSMECFTGAPDVLTRAPTGAPGVFAGAPTGALGLVFGFPCTDTSSAGRRRGLDGSESSLVFEALRLGEELKVSWMFVENVPGMASNGFDERLFSALKARGFRYRSTMLTASSAGSPQRRKRWFMLAWRGSFSPELLMPKQDLTKHIRDELGLRFNGGRPNPPADWMTDIPEYRKTKSSLELLGNAVVTVQAMLAFSVLAHKKTAAARFASENKKKNKKLKSGPDQNAL
jgi:site-specific DNA-cytosine methylase